MVFRAMSFCTHYQNKTLRGGPTPFPKTSLTSNEMVLEEEEGSNSFKLSTSRAQHVRLHTFSSSTFSLRIRVVPLHELLEEATKTLPLTRHMQLQPFLRTLKKSCYSHEGFLSLRLGGNDRSEAHPWIDRWNC